MLTTMIGPLRLDERKGVVSDGQGALAISRKGVELLVRLGRAGGQAVRREALLRELWPERQVGDKALSMLVVETRRQLAPYFGGEDPIQTVPGIGYVLTTPYERSESPQLLPDATREAYGKIPVVVMPPVLLTQSARTSQLAACWFDTLLNSLGAEPGLETCTRVPAVPEPHALQVESSVRVVRTELILSLRCVTASDGKIRWAATERGDAAHAYEMETRLCDTLRHELRLANSGYSGRRMWTEYRRSSGFTALSDGQRSIGARSPLGLSEARTSFNHALSQDPNCAPALVGLADCAILSAFYDGAQTDSAIEKALAYVDRALAVDAGLATAYSTRGFILLAQLRFGAAEQALLKAISLDGTSAIALQWYADFLTTQGRLADAIRIGQLALVRAPDSPVVNCQLGQLLHMAGAFEEAHPQLLHASQLDPQAALPHCFLAFNLALHQRDPAAIEHARLAIELAPSAPFFRGALGAVLAHLGEHDRAQQQLQRLEAHASNDTAHAEAAMLVAAALGQTRRAVSWFRTVIAKSACWTLYAPALPILRPIHDEPSFQGLVRGCGMENPSN